MGFCEDGNSVKVLFVEFLRSFCFICVVGKFFFFGSVFGIEVIGFFFISVLKLFFVGNYFFRYVGIYFVKVVVRGYSYVNEVVNYV